GSNISMGFLNMQDKTRKTLDEDGRLHSGDLRVIDQEGFLYITGIIKDLIRAAGENIPPLSIIRNSMLIRRKLLSLLLTVKIIFRYRVISTAAVCAYCKCSLQPVIMIYEEIYHIRYSFNQNQTSCLHDGILQCTCFVKEHYDLKKIRVQNICKFHVMEPGSSDPNLSFMKKQHCQIHHTRG
uniref:AMP-dependent synthetase/ligase domain-containing protein n=1 Tax=Scophthalmus maximus TaxID=52904 RepID=A0A8D3BWI9_SCOMX